ncbi:MAG: ROK family protein [Melioribacter sp.]|nr:ROK family protein [Melioribacter sp.]
MSKKFIVSIDLGGTKILSSLINSEAEIISKVKVATEVKEGPNKIVELIVNSFYHLIEENKITEENIKALCLGVPGTVNPFTGIISNAPNLLIKDFNIKEELSKFISAPILIENDVNLAGLGIKRFELNNKVENMIVVFIGTGIGAALFFDGKLYRGSTFYAGEIGHIKVNSKGAFSSKSTLTTLELSASRTAIVKAIKKEIKKGKKSLLKEFISNNKTIKSKTLANAIESRDPLTIKYVKKASITIGTVLGSLTTLLNFDTIVLGGGVIEAMQQFMMPLIIEAFYAAVLPECGKNVKLVATKLGDDAPLYGGVELANEFVA